MAPRVQLWDAGNGDARILDVDTATNVLSVKSADSTTTHATLPPDNRFTEPLGGQYRVRDNQTSGWGTVGPVDDSNTQNLGGMASTNLSRLAGGYMYPYNVRLRSMYAEHRNSSALIEPWGWVIFLQKKTPGTNNRVTTFLVHEPNDNGGVGPRNYGNNTNQSSSIDLTAITAAQDIAPQTLIGLGVATPTTANPDLWVQVMAGYLELERV